MKKKIQLAKLTLLLQELNKHFPRYNVKQRMPNALDHLFALKVEANNIRAALSRMEESHNRSSYLSIAEEVIGVNIKPVVLLSDAQARDLLHQRLAAINSFLSYCGEKPLTNPFGLKFKEPTFNFPKKEITEVVKKVKKKHGIS